MSYPITTADVAGILDALGKPDAAATLRWLEPEPAEERDNFEDELEHANDMLDNLEALLCRDCAKKWKGQQ